MAMRIEELQKLTGLKTETITTLQKFDLMFNESNQKVAPAQIEQVQRMLAAFIGATDINHKLTPIAPYSRRDTGIGAAVIGIVKNLTYRTRHLDKIFSEMNRIWENFQRAIKEGQSLKTNEKITLEQYGILHDLATLNRTFNGLNKKGFLGGNEKLMSLYQQTQRAAEMIKYFDDSFDSKFKVHPGTVVFDNTVKKSKIYGKKLGVFEKNIDFFVTRFGHASKGLSVDNEMGHQNKISHINPNYKEEAFSLRNFLYSDTYQIKIENLIEPKTKNLLKQHLGENWLELTKNKYAQIERDIHDGAHRRYSHVIADGSKTRLAKIATVFCQGGHKNFLIKDHSNEEIRDLVFGRDKWAEKRPNQELLCSEFVGMTVIASIQELNDILIAELEEKNVEFIPEEIIKSPIDQKEKLHLLTPERLLIAMRERGAVVKVDAPKEINQHISNDSSKITQSMRENIRKMKDAERSLSEPVMRPKNI